MNAHDPYSFWRSALAGQPGELATATDPATGFAYPEPAPGFYRNRRRDGGWDAIAVYEHEGALWAKVNDRAPIPADATFAEKVFAWACKNPVTHEAYTAVVERGEPWPDLAHMPDKPNAPADADPAEALADQIEACEARLAAFETIADDDTAGQAQALRARLNELAGEADKIREKEKRPHLEAGKAIDAKWQPLVKRAKAGADKVKVALSAFATAQARKRAEEERKAREAEEAARAQAEPDAIEELLAQPPRDEPAPAAPPMAIKGAYGRTASVSMVKVVTAIADQDALYRFMRDRAEIKDVLMTLARRAVKAGHDVPGVTVEEQAEVR